MIKFPNKTYIHKRISKEKFYKNLDITKETKESFVSDIDKIYIENSLNYKSLNIDKTEGINEVIVLCIELKKKEFNRKIIEAIARQNPHKLLFMISFDDNVQLAIYHRKLYTSLWMSKDKAELKVSGFSIDEIWEHFVEQIALYEESAEATENLSIDERLVLQERIIKLEMQIAKTEKAVWREQQPKKRFELYTRLQGYKKQLAELKG